MYKYYDQRRCTELWQVVLDVMKAIAIPTRRGVVPWWAPHLHVLVP